LGGAGGLIAQSLIEAGSAVAGENRGAGVVFLRGEKVVGAGETGQVAQAHDLAPLGFAERQDAPWESGAGTAKTATSTWICARSAESLRVPWPTSAGSSPNSPAPARVAKDRQICFEVRSRDLGAERALGRRPDRVCQP